MKLFWICILVIAVVIVLYVVIHRILIHRATMMVRRNAQQVTDKAVNESLESLLSWHKTLSSEIVADVWGKGVLAFEYHFESLNDQENGGRLTREQLTKKLEEYAQKQGIKARQTDLPPFVITDWWTYEQILHIDVAYLTNEATIEYIEDLKRLKVDQTKK